MKKYFARKTGSGLLLALFAFLFAYAGLASADPVAFANVNFQNGQGTLSGYFQTDGAAQISSWDLQSSTFDCNPCGLSHGFPGVHYTEATSTAQVSFFAGNQSITFHDNASTWQLSFILDCGGGGADCIGNATLGSTIPLSSAFEMDGIDFLPFRALDLAVLDVTDPPVGFSFNVAPGDGTIPEPRTLMLLLPAFAALVGARRKNAARRVA